MTKNNKRLIIFFIFLIIFFLLILLKFNIPCYFKKIFSIPCPSCGLTRSIFSILNLNIIKSIYYNILGIPIFVITIITYLLILIDIIKKENYLTSFWLFLSKKYKFIIILLVISFFINNIHNI